MAQLGGKLTYAAGCRRISGILTEVHGIDSGCRATLSETGHRKWLDRIFRPSFTGFTGWLPKLELAALPTRSCCSGSLPAATQPRLNFWFGVTQPWSSRPA